MTAKSYSVTRCPLCGGTLDIPFVYFLCGHGYHQSCLNGETEEENECSTCKAKINQYMDKINEGRKLASDPEKFFNDLNNEALNTNYQNLENYDNKFSISENQNDRKEATQSSYQNEIELNLQNSQRDHDITISDRDNPLIYSDDKGNMNFLERKYMAYQNRMHQNNENY